MKVAILNCLLLIVVLYCVHYFATGHEQINRAQEMAATGRYLEALELATVFTMEKPVWLWTPGHKRLISSFLDGAFIAQIEISANDNFGETFEALDAFKSALPNDFAAPEVWDQLRLSMFRHILFLILETGKQHIRERQYADAFALVTALQSATPCGLATPDQWASVNEQLVRKISNILIEDLLARIERGSLETVFVDFKALEAAVPPDAKKSEAWAELTNSLTDALTRRFYLNASDEQWWDLPEAFYQALRSCPPSLLPLAELERLEVHYLAESIVGRTVLGDSNVGDGFDLAKKYIDELRSLMPEQRWREVAPERIDDSAHQEWAIFRSLKGAIFMLGLC